MTIFKLPDLGEGLPDAEIHEWFVKPGDKVTTDQPLVAMETAKAIVEVPCPEDGLIEILYGQPGDIITTGSPLVGYTPNQPRTDDEGTVVGHLQQNSEAISLTHLPWRKITPRTRLLGRQPPPGFEALHGTRRAMLRNMQIAHQHVVPVSLFEDADVSAWIEQGDITVRVIRAIQFACGEEPALNAWFDTASGARQCFSVVNLGLAMDSPEGLFVPVIHDIKSLSDDALRQLINEKKRTVSQRRMPAEQFQGASIHLSNFGKFAGRFATALVIPPTVTMLAVGRLYTGVVAVNGVAQCRALLPLSLSFDHRAVTGGEASRFLSHVLAALRG